MVRTRRHAKTRRKTDERPRDLRQAGVLCLAFANTSAPSLDRRSKPETRDAKAPTLGDYADLVDWGWRMGVLEPVDVERLRQTAAKRPDEADETFVRALALRDGLVRIFTAVAFGQPAPPADLDRLGEILAEAQPVRQLVQRGRAFGWDWRPHEGLDTVLWWVADSAVELLFSEDLKTVCQCAGEDCTRLFAARYGRLRKWCDMNTCGNRVKGKRHYQRSAMRRSRIRF